MGAETCAEVTTPPPPPKALLRPKSPTVVAPGERRAVVDEEYVEGPPPVVRPYPWWLWALAGICLALAILFLVLWLMERNDTKDVPSLVGLSAAQARDKASTDGFTLETLSRPSGQPSGTVIDQAPQAGAGLEKGAQVMAIVSGGQAQVTVPKLIGSTATAAEQLLESQGLTGEPALGRLDEAEGDRRRAGSARGDEGREGHERRARGLERQRDGEGAARCRARARPTPCRRSRRRVSSRSSSRCRRSRPRGT